MFPESLLWAKAPCHMVNGNHLLSKYSLLLWYMELIYLVNDPFTN